MDEGASFELTPSQKAVRDMARKTAETEFRDRALTWERDATFPWRNMRILAERGLLGATIPVEYGGGGGDWLDAAVILEELGRCCYTTAMAALGELGVQTRAIGSYGTEAQKRKYLPKVADGTLICSICITEPDTGSDIKAMTTTATVSGDDVTISGTKTLISRADVAGLFVVYVRFADTGGIGAVLVERETPGLSVGPPFATLGREGLYEVRFEDVHVGVDNILVRDDGFRKMLRAFNGQRCLNAAISIGIAQGAQDAAVEHAKTRVQGGRPIGRYQGIGWMLADNAIDIEAARLLVYRAAARAGAGFPSRYEAAIAKTFANEMALRVTDRAMQIFGGHGWAEEVGIERYVRWARYGPLGGGTPQIQRNGIARELLGP